MIINTEIIDTYFTENSLEVMKNHWIFNSIVEGEYLFEEPKNVDVHKLRDIYRILVKKLQNFEPLNKYLWQQFFGNMMVSDIMLIYLVVGSPKPYDAMVRRDAEGNECIIIDLIRISSYSDDIGKLSGIVSNFVTHEMAHIYIHKAYPYPTIEDTIFDNLKYIVFDEGIAHFLAFKEDVLSIDWYSDEMRKRRKKSYETLASIIKKDSIEDKEQILEKANSGLFWEKFGAISGLFAIVDYYNSNTKDIKELNTIFEKGPDLLIDFILNSAN